MKSDGEIKKTIPERPKFPLSPEEIDGCRNRILSTHRAPGIRPEVVNGIRP